MIGAFERMVDSIVEGVRVDKFDKAFIAKLRADFKLLLGNFDKVKIGDPATKLVAALERFVDYLSEMFYVEGNVEDESAKQGSFFGMMLTLFASDPDFGKQAWADATVQNVSRLMANLKHDVMVGIKQIVVNGKFDADSEDDLQFFAISVGSAAKDLFSYLDVAVSGIDRMSSGQRTGTMKTTVREPAEIEGFQCVMLGYDETDKMHRKALDLAKQGLRDLRRKAAERCPLILKLLKSVNIHFDCHPGILGVYYLDSGTINVCTSAVLDNTGSAYEFVKTLAHETSHFIYHRILSSKARNLWVAACNADKQKVDLKALIKAWPARIQGAEKAIRVIGDTNPNAAIALTTLIGSGVKVGNMRLQLPAERAMFVAAVKKVINDPLTAQLVLPAHPVSAYGNSDPVETYAEVGGNFVAYGPKTIPPEVMRLFRIVSGDILKA